MRVRPLIGIAISLCILTVSAFWIFVWLTSSLNTQPMQMIPSVLGLAVGLFLCIRVPDNNIGLVVLAAILSFSVLDIYDLVQDWGVANGHPILAMIASTSGMLAFGGVLTTLLILLPIWFPDGVAISRWSRWVARTAMLLMSVALFGAIFSERVCVASGDFESCPMYVTNPWGIPGLDSSQFELVMIGLFLLALPAIAALVLRWRRSSGVERAQLKWFSLAAVVSVLGFTITVANQSLIGTDGAAWISTAVLSGLWVSIGFAVAKYHLYDIDRVISRGLGYILVVGLLGLVYAVGAVWLPTRLMGEQSPIFVAGSTLAIAALFRPVRARTLRWIDRFFYRSRYDAEAIAASFSATLRAEHDVDQLSEGWTRVVIEALHPSSAGIWLKG